MPLNQLALITITITFKFLLTWVIAELIMRLKGYKVEQYEKINYTVKFNAVLSLVAVSIACVFYFIGWVS